MKLSYAPLLLAVAIALLSTLCAAQDRCMTNSAWRSQVQKFVDIMARKPDIRRSLIPDASDLFEFGCSQVEKVHKPNRDPADEEQHLDWFLLFILGNFWLMEEGLNPYAEMPFSWLFMNNQTVYRVPDAGLAIVGAEAIQATFRRLGVPFAANGSGFWISDVTLNELYVGKSKIFGQKNARVFSEVHKTIVNQDFLGAALNTTRAMRYHLKVSVVRRHAYPKLLFSQMDETVDTQRTLELFDACYLCTDCPPGQVCGSGGALARRQVEEVLPKDILDERDKVLAVQMPIAFTPQMADAYALRLAAARGIRVAPIASSA